MILSEFSTTSIEDVAQASGSGLRWLQMRLRKEKVFNTSMIQRAEQCGYRALVITIDAPVLGRRLADCRNIFSLPSHLKMVNFSAEKLQDSSWYSVGTKLYQRIDSSLTWECIAWIKSITRLPVIVKGVLTGEDALLAVQHGVDGIIVSNHGGRQLDGVLATVSYYCIDYYSVICTNICKVLGVLYLCTIMRYMHRCMFVYTQIMHNQAYTGSRVMHTWFLEIAFVQESYKIS